MTRKTTKPAAADASSGLMALVQARLRDKLEAGDCTTAELLKLMQHLQQFAPPPAPQGRDLHIVLAEDG